MAFPPRTTAEWLEECARIGVPASPLRLREELFDDPQVWANEAFVHLEHDLVGGLTTVAPPVRYSATPLVASRASPPLGYHSRDVLRDLGLSREAINRLIARGVVRDYRETGD
jgi:crotonobetainyl-CoA:carnitine CoA-transferase CaiB-like acyl-CoA transferase